MREAAAWAELGAYAATAPLWGLAPRGDGHPVLVLPGPNLGDLSTQPLRGFLRARGFGAVGWGLGRNTGRSGFYEALSGDRAGDPEFLERFGGPLTVPTTSIYSRRDGIVAWQCCINNPGSRVENIAVTSTHCGMGHHPAVLYAVADRLAQPEGNGRPSRR